MTGKTKVISVGENAIQAIEEALDVLRKGGLVAFPTETVYGLGADAMNSTAVERVFAVKGRPATNPLIVHVASLEVAEKFAVAIPEKGQKLAETFFPGPLTLVLHARSGVPRVVTGGLDTVAIRIPRQEFTLQLLKCFGSGLVGPSANISGSPSPTLASHVLHDFDGKIELILDAGQTHIGVESTVVDVTIDPPVILRAGGISQNEIESIIGPVEHAGKGHSLRHRSPGTRFRHYAPNAKVVIVQKGQKDELERLVAQCREEGKHFCVVTHSFRSMKIQTDDNRCYYYDTLTEYARNLFRILRKADEEHCDIVLVEAVEEKGLGVAIMDRLRRAAEE